MLKHEKYLYLISFGGLNDTINQIIIGYEYCIRTGRTLIVNTKHSRQKRNIQDYFSLKNDIIFQGNDTDFANYASSMRIYPPCDLGSLEFEYDHIVKNMVSSNGTSFAIDLTNERGEEVIVFGDCTLSGQRTNEFFKLFPMRDNVRRILQRRYNTLPPNYISVHIRNTDHQSDVSEFIETNRQNFNGKNIFLASDNTDSITEFRSKIDAKVYTFSNIPRYADNPKIGIHKRNVDNKEELNIDSIVDLVILSLGEAIFYSCPHSGYSINAVVMHKDTEFRENVLSQIRKES